MLDSDFFLTRVGRPKLFIQRLIWIDPATFPKLSTLVISLKIRCATKKQDEKQIACCQDLCDI